MRDAQEPGPGPERTPADARRARVERLRALVAEIFPGEGLTGLRENIERSFGVPQVGDYHNEGMFMDSHLDLIIANIERVARGEFPEEIAPAVREMLTRAVLRDPESVKRYVFLHDISKADCLTLKFGNEARAVTWEEWQGMLAASDSGRRALAGDEQALRDFCAEQGLTGVSYFQGADDGKRQHGKIGADELRAAGVTDAAMLAAIETHEVAFLFQAIKVSTYEKYFGEMDADTRDFALLASYVDTMSSLRPDGTPDLANFLALAGSREKSESLRVLEGRLAGAELDARKFARAWSALVASTDPLTADMIDTAEARLRETCKAVRYDVEKLRAAVEPLVAEGKLSEADRDRLLSLAESDPQAVGKAFEPLMGALGPILRTESVKKPA